MLQISIPDEQILKINSDVSVEEAAREYEEKLTTQLPSLQLDLALCGMGPDGHTCSLFPGIAGILSYQLKLVAARLKKGTVKSF